MNNFKMIKKLINNLIKITKLTITTNKKWQQ